MDYIKITEKGMRLFNDTINLYNDFIEQCDLTEKEFLAFNDYDYGIDKENDRLFVSAVNEKKERFEFKVNIPIKDKSIAKWLFTFISVKTNSMNNLVKWEVRINDRQ